MQMCVGITGSKTKDGGKIRQGCSERTRLWLIFQFAAEFPDFVLILGQAVPKLPGAILSLRVPPWHARGKLWSVGKWCELAQRVLGEACLDVGKAAGVVCGRQERVLFHFHLNNEH